MEDKLSYKPGTILQGVYKSYGPKFGFLITDEDMKMCIFPTEITSMRSTMTR